jgi:hypothetical protein
MHGGFAQFAAFDQDVIDNKAAVGRGRLKMPVLALGGDHSLGPTMAYIMRFAADNVREVVITESGHWLMEEQPKATVSAIVDFLSADSSIDSRTLGVAEISALARSGSGVGTSGVGGIQTIVLSGDPAKPGPYAIELKIPAHTHIAAHSHRDKTACNGCLGRMALWIWHKGRRRSNERTYAGRILYRARQHAPLRLHNRSARVSFHNRYGTERYALRRGRSIPKIGVADSKWEETYARIGGT